MEKKKVVPEDYLVLKKVSSIEASEKGLITWVETTPNPIEGYNSAIKAYNVASGKVLQFTNGIKRDYSPKFTSDGNKMYFLSTRMEKPQVFVMDLVNGGEAQKVTSAVNGVSSFELSPNNKLLAYTAACNNEELAKLKEEKPKPKTKYEAELLKKEKEEKERLFTDPRVIDTLVYREGTSFHDGRKQYVFVFDLAEKTTTQITAPPHDHWSVQWLSDGELLAVSKRDEPVDLSFDVTVLTFNLDEKQEGTPLISFKSWKGAPVKVSPDKKHLTFARMKDEEPLAGQTAQFVVYDIATRTEVDVNSRFDRAMVDWKWLNDDAMLLLVEDTGTYDLRKYTLSTDEVVTLHRSNNALTSVCEYNGIYYATATSVLHPNTVWAITDEVTLIDEPNQEYLDTHIIVEPEEMWFESAEGVKYQGWWFPPVEAAEKPPFALHIHGGPHVMWIPAGTMWHEFQCFASAGYAGLATNPLGSNGYGEKFSQSIVKEWGVKDAKDLIDLLDVVKDKVDTEHMYVSGGSYAGFQTANIVSRTNKFRAAVAQRGVYEGVTFGLTTDIPIWYDKEMGNPWDNLDTMWNLNPTGRAKHIETPLMIIASENDFRVPISQSETLFASLKLQNKECVFIRYPRDGHELSRSGEPLHVVDRLEKMFDWFATHK